MKQRTNKTKRITIVFIAVICMVMIASISVAAKTYTSTHTVSVASVSGSSDVYYATMGKKGRMSDTFSNYPTVFDGKTTSNDKARAVNETTGKTYSWKSFTLNSNSSAPTTVVYGNSLAKGSYRIIYKYVSGGGFRASSILSKTY